MILYRSLALHSNTEITIMTENPGSGTRAVWGGVSFGYRDVDEWMDVALGKKPGHIYGRNTNPTVSAFEQKVRSLESAEAATSFSTGMADCSVLQ
jgi:O-acetylhomoserine/O-acetylserine sulfhydrylase-like pyridoxal-dependent enzyme